MALKHINDSDFDSFVKTGITIVDFWASWCGPCRMFGPIFEAESGKHAEVSFGKYEITDSNRRAAAKYGVRSIPSILAFKNGEVLDTKIGLMDEAMFSDWVRSLS